MLFDATSTFMSLVPVVLHTFVIMGLNGIYRRVAENLTAWENHRTETEHNNALIIKRFFFEAFDCYIALFYIAFFEQDILKLRSEMVSLFTADQFRRVFTESLVPFVMLSISRYQKRRDAAAQKKDDDAKAKDADGVLAEELEFEEHELFDDYLELVMQFGYITLFASAFPLAFAISMLSNMVEVRSDAFKLSFVMKRPVSAPAKNAGIWDSILTVTVWSSVITNVFVFGFASDQMVVWFPSMFEHTVAEGADADIADGRGRIVIALLFAFEHAFIIIGLLLMYFISPVPKEVKVWMAREEYVKTEALRSRLRSEHQRVRQSVGGAASN